MRQNYRGIEKRQDRGVFRGWLSAQSGKNELTIGKERGNT